MAVKPGRGRPSGRHVAIVAACCLTCGVPAAMILSTAGLFYPIIASDLGVPTAQVSSWMSVSMIASAVFSPIVGNLLARYNVRNFMIAGVLAGAVAMGLFSVASSPWELWLAGGITGFTLVTCLSVVPTLLVNRWFGKHVGLIVGVCTSFTGIGGVVFLMLGQGLIDAYGWRVAYLAFAVITLVVCLPAIVLCVRERPSDCNLEQYGVDPAALSSRSGSVVSGPVEAPVAPARPNGEAACEPPDSRAFPPSHGPTRRLARIPRFGTRPRFPLAPPRLPGVARPASAVLASPVDPSSGSPPRPATDPPPASPPGDMRVRARRQMRTPAFWQLMACGFFMNFVSQVNGYFPMYVGWLDEQAAYGMTAGAYTTGAMLLALSQVGNAAGKIGLGAAIDLSPGKALVLLGACGVFGVALVWLAPTTPLLAVGGLVFGVFIAGGIVLLPLLVRTVFGGGDAFELLFSRISAAPTVGSAVGNVLFPTLAEGAGGFDALFSCSLASVAVVLATALLALSRTPRPISRIT